MDNSNNENSDTSHGMTPQTFVAEAVVPIGDVSTSPLNKRKSVDWVAAGHKAWATRRRNAALRLENTLPRQLSDDGSANTQPNADQESS